MHFKEKNLEGLDINPPKAAINVLKKVIDMGYAELTKNHQTIYTVEQNANRPINLLNPVKLIALFDSAPERLIKQLKMLSLIKLYRKGYYHEVIIDMTIIDFATRHQLADNIITNYFND